MPGLGITTAVLLALAAGTAAALEISERTPATVVVATEATEAEQTAAQEVADYLHRATGAQVAMASEKTAPQGGNRVFVGPTAAAAKLGLDPARLGPEEWIARTAGRDLYLVGGRPRGTLYAAYHFLEEVAGVHWWTPWEESVPSRRVLRVGSLHLRGRPAFRYRDIYMLYGGDGGRFAARNRLNREGDAPMESRYGGSLAYGPPYHVHTAYTYFPPKEYFAQHPEWYSLLNGQRTGEGGQLCWTNPELRQAFLAKLVAYIETSHAAARAAGLPPPLVFSVSQNDWANPCQCERCQAMAKAEGSEAGPLLDFVNHMAEGVRDKYPDVFIDTLAYQYTQQAPRTIKAQDNVIIRLCDTDADMLRPITAPENRAFREHIRSWARIASNLRIWDYAVTYGNPPGMPLPTSHTYGPDYRFYRAHRVEGVFTELEYGILADLRDFKVWCMMKTLEDPEADYRRLTDTFMTGYYGPAGEPIKQYLQELEAEAARRGSRSTCWQGSPMQLTYLNPDFVTRAQRLFDQAERAVRGEATLMRRVRHARLPLDRATLAAYPKLAWEWRQGGGAGSFPLDRELVARRALDTWKAQADLRLPQAQRETERLAAEGEIGRFLMAPGKTDLPEKFRPCPPGTVYDYPATMTRNWGNVVKVVKDPEAESGITNRLDLTDEGVEQPERYALPMPWGLYGTADKKSLEGEPIKGEDIPGPGYHWYKMGTFPLAPGYYLYFFWSWIIQLDIDNAWDPARPEQEFEIWARVRFQGPRFPHAQAGEKDAISVERVVLVKRQ